MHTYVARRIPPYTKVIKYILFYTASKPLIVSRATCPIFGCRRNPAPRQLPTVFRTAVVCRFIPPYLSWPNEGKKKETHTEISPTGKVSSGRRFTSILQEELPSRTHELRTKQERSWIQALLCEVVEQTKQPKQAKTFIFCLRRLQFPNLRIPSFLT